MGTRMMFRGVFVTILNCKLEECIPAESKKKKKFLERNPILDMFCKPFIVLVIPVLLTVGYNSLIICKSMKNQIHVVGDGFQVAWIVIIS